METGTTRSPRLGRCLQLNALALAFSLTHVIADLGLFAFGPGVGLWVGLACAAVAGAIYGWWGWSMAQLARDGRTGLTSLLLLCGLWAVAQGASFVFIPLTEYLANLIHFGSLIFGAWGAHATWRLRRARRPSMAGRAGLPTPR